MPKPLPPSLNENPLASAFVSGALYWHYREDDTPLADEIIWSIIAEAQRRYAYPNRPCTSKRIDGKYRIYHVGVMSPTGDSVREATCEACGAVVRG